MPDITSCWQREVLVADGAMGTLLFARGGDVWSCAELLNLHAPDIVRQAHLDYMGAGARIIETNTFAANRLKLSTYGLAADLEKINRLGVAIARDAAGGQVWVAGSIGPLGAPLWPLGITRPDEAKDIFAQQASAIANAGVDLIILETFGSLSELLLALEAAKQMAKVPVLASLSATGDGTTISGDPLGQALAHLTAAGADAVGVNCAVGPQAIYDALVRFPPIKAPLSIMPNAGYPHRVDDRMVYESSPQYFGDFARRFRDLGASIVGGCCGTTPNHIRAVASAVGGTARHHRESAPEVVSAPTSRPQVRLQPHAPPATAFERKLGNQFIVAVEIASPRGTDTSQAVAAAKRLEAVGADAVHISDNPTARLRMSGSALAHLIMRETQLATILHLGCRDRNLLGLQSELLGAAALGVTGVLALTGDPSTFGDFPKATSVFDVTALGLTQMLAALNAGKDQAGNDIGRPTRFHIGAAVSPATKTLRGELEKLQAKRAAGADFAVTQPVFDLESIAPFLVWACEQRFPVLIGVLLLRSYRNAEFLHNEVPGMHVPEFIRERLRTSTNQAADGVAIARDLLIQLRRTPGVAGAYLISQEQYEAAAQAVAFAQDADASASPAADAP